MEIQDTTNSESRQFCWDGRVVGGECIANNQACFVRLWLRLERTRQLFKAQYRRYSVRNVLKEWLGADATDDFIWEVCQRASRDEVPVYGYDLLPKPSLYPRVHRELLHAVVQVKLGLKHHQVKLSMIDEAYSIAFPQSTPINVSKKKKSN